MFLEFLDIKTGDRGQIKFESELQVRRYLFLATQVNPDYTAWLHLMFDLLKANTNCDDLTWFFKQALSDFEEPLFIEGCRVLCGIFTLTNNAKALKLLHQSLSALTMQLDQTFDV